MKYLSVKFLILLAICSIWALICQNYIYYNKSYNSNKTNLFFEDSDVLYEPNIDKIEKVYNLLNDEYELGTLEEFAEAMNLEDNRISVYHALTEKYSFSNVRSFKEFEIVLGFKKNNSRKQ